MDPGVRQARSAFLCWPLPSPPSRPCLFLNGYPSREPCSPAPRPCQPLGFCLRVGFRYRFGCLGNALPSLEPAFDVLEALTNLLFEALVGGTVIDTVAQILR